MALKKSQLYSSIWASCDELRGGMDASQYKNYVLVLLFVKYVSDKYAGIPNAVVEIPEGGSFADMVKLKGTAEIGDGINKVIEKLAEANELSGIINTPESDFNDEDKLGKGKEMVDRLSNLIGIFEKPELHFAKNRADGDDILGDAYEYLMKHFATESGKSKGQFYTPAEVSRIMAKVIDADRAESPQQTVYDMACGSGSLLLKVADETPNGITIYGQEMDNSTAALAIMNMWLHNNPGAIIKKGQSTLSTPLNLAPDNTLKTFDFAVANPPFSNKSWMNGINWEVEKENYKRFDGYGIPPAKNGDYAFLLHMLKSLKSTGRGAIILPHGVLFRGNTEAEIRKNIIKRGYIKGIIGLPANLFYGTGIPACILILDKSNATSRTGIFMIDASKGFVKDGNKNRLREQDIRKIVDVFRGRLEVPKFSRFVSNKEIEEKDYNLNIPRYIDTQEEEDIQDIESHLKGGIPEHDIDRLINYWKALPSLRNVLFSPGERAHTYKVAIEKDEVRNTIYHHKDFVSFRENMQEVLQKWNNENKKKMQAIKIGDRPKVFIDDLGRSILVHFADKPLIEKYDIYQHLMTYWLETMQDDLYTLVIDGWNAGKQVIRLQKESKGKNGTDNKKKDILGLEGLEGRLIPADLIISEYFDKEKSELTSMESELESTIALMEESKEEHGGDEGLLSEVMGDDKVSKPLLSKKIKEKKHDSEYKEELSIWERYQDLLNQETAMKKQIKIKYAELEKRVIEKYPTLTLEEVKSLVIDKKWLTALEEAVNGEVEKVAQQLAGRVKELAERYDETLSQINDDVKVLEQKVEEHLNKMGYKI